LSILEIAVVLLVALVVIGPEKLPDVLVAIGRLMRELRLASNTVMRELTSTADDLPEVLRPYRSPETGPPPPARTPEKSAAPDPAPPAGEPKPPLPQP
jgi:Sec-independent protein translocase protein TatA